MFSVRSLKGTQDSSRRPPTGPAWFHPKGSKHRNGCSCKWGSFLWVSCKQIGVYLRALTFGNSHIRFALAYNKQDLVWAIWSPSNSCSPIRGRTGFGQLAVESPISTSFLGIGLLIPQSRPPSSSVGRSKLRHFVKFRACSLCTTVFGCLIQRNVESLGLQVD